MVSRLQNNKKSLPNNFENFDKRNSNQKLSNYTKILGYTRDVYVRRKSNNVNLLVRKHIIKKAK